MWMALFVAISSFVGLVIAMAASAAKTVVTSEVGRRVVATGIRYGLEDATENLHKQGHEVAAQVLPKAVEVTALAAGAKLGGVPAAPIVAKTTRIGK